jgi:hypothetical protein
MPRRELFLVRKDTAWAICIKATGKLAGQPGKIVAWLRDHDESYFCQVGEESQIERLPQKNGRNFFGDQFTFAIDETDAKGNKIQDLAGANNMIAAKAAFHCLVNHHPPQRHIMLRQGARIILKAHDLKVER